MKRPNSRQNLVSADESKPVFPARPFQLVSLLDMLRLHAGLVFGTLTQLQKYEARFKKQRDAGNGGAALTPREKNQFNAITGVALAECESLHLKDAQKRKRRIRRYFDVSRLGQRPIRLTYDDAFKEIEELREAILVELNQNIFLKIPSDLKHYYDDRSHPESPLAKALQPSSYAPLFDDETKPLEERFSQRWPNANKEIASAGNSYATGNNTACVFHLMRAIEYGIRSLAKDLKVTKGKDKDHLPYPIELCDWGTIARVLREKIDQISARKTLKTSRKISFYNDALTHFSALKDVRNRICHTRTQPYDPYQARSVFDSTEHFMRHVNQRLTELSEKVDNAGS